MINAAIVGLGWWGQNILKNLLNSPVIKPVLGVDPLESARASAAALGVETAPRFEDALANSGIDAVILCTPQERHAEQIVAAARAGTPRLLREAAMHDAPRTRRQRACGRAEGRRPARYRPRTPVRTGRHRDAKTVCGRRVRQSAAAGGQFQPGHVPEIASRQLAIVEDGESGGPALGHRHSHGRSFDRFSGTARPASGRGWRNWAAVSKMAIRCRSRSALPAAPPPYWERCWRRRSWGGLRRLGSKGWMEIRDRSHPENSTGWDVHQRRTGMKRR